MVTFCDIIVGFSLFLGEEWILIFMQMVHYCHLGELDTREEQKGEAQCNIKYKNCSNITAQVLQVDYCL